MAKMEYSLRRNIKYLERRAWAHLHCPDISEFGVMYADALDAIVPHFNIIVTFSDPVNKAVSMPAVDAVYLEVSNSPIDTGGKYCAMNFLKAEKIEYDCLLMVQYSDTAPDRRRVCFSGVLEHLPELFREMSPEIGIFVPNILQRNRDLADSVPREQETILQSPGLMETPELNYMFPDGQAYIVNRSVVEHIFNNFVDLYERLGAGNGFDYPWFIQYYNVPSLAYSEAFEKFNKGCLHGNRIDSGDPPFDRIPFEACKHLGLRVHVLNSTDTGEAPGKNRSSPCTLLTRAVVACHTSSELKLRALMHNMQYYSKAVTDIFVVNSSEFKGAIENALDLSPARESYIINRTLTDSQADKYLNAYPDLKRKLKTPELVKTHYLTHGYSEGRAIPGATRVTISYQKNSNMVGQAKWESVLAENLRNYQRTMLTNDSFLIVNESFQRFVKYAHRSDASMVGLIDSYETAEHYPDFLRIYDAEGIRKWREFYAERASGKFSYFDVITQMEIASSTITRLHESYFTVPRGYCGNMHFDDSMHFKFITEFAYPVVKLKKLLSATYALLPPAKEQGGIPVDFDPEVYTRLNPALASLGPQECFHHYVSVGRAEKLQYRLPVAVDDFDPEIYKEIQADLNHMTSEEAYRHFYLHGCTEGRKYRPTQESSVPAYLTAVCPPGILDTL